MTEPITTDTPEGAVAAAESPATGLTDAPAVGTTPDAPQGDTGDDSADDDPADDGKAARYRKRAQAAEAERDKLTATLTATRQQIVDAALTARGFDNDRLKAAAAIDVADVLDDDGQVDPALLAAAVDAAAEDLNVRAPSRRPIPNPLVGSASNDRPLPDGLQAFREAFAAKR
jgi:hypothetical protein